METCIIDDGASNHRLTHKKKATLEKLQCLWMRVLVTENLETKIEKLN